jgi:hypothetical protein
MSNKELHNNMVLKTLVLSIDHSDQVITAVNPKTCEKTDVLITNTKDKDLSVLIGQYIHSKTKNPYSLIGIAEDLELHNKFALYKMLYNSLKPGGCKGVSRNTIFIRDLYNDFFQEVEIDGRIVQRFIRDALSDTHDKL